MVVLCLLPLTRPVARVSKGNVASITHRRVCGAFRAISSECKRLSKPVSVPELVTFAEGVSALKRDPSTKIQIVESVVASVFHN